jgi:hypothetical protein
VIEVYGEAASFDVSRTLGDGGVGSGLRGVVDFVFDFRAVPAYR